MWCFDGNEVYYTIKEAAEMIGVSYRIIQRRFRNGLIEGAFRKLRRVQRSHFTQIWFRYPILKSKKSGLKWRTELKME